MINSHHTLSPTSSDDIFREKSLQTQFHNLHFNQIMNNKPFKPQFEHASNEVDSSSEFDSKIDLGEQQKKSPKVVQLLDHFTEQVRHLIEFDLDHQEQLELQEYQSQNQQEFDVYYQDALLSMNQQSFFFSIAQKNQIELLRDYRDSYPLLRFRKDLMYLASFIIKSTVSIVCAKIIKNQLFDTFILCIILLNTITLMLNTNNSSYDQATFDNIDLFMMISYTIEMFLKILGMGLVMDKKAYLRDLWNIMDFVIVIMSMIPYLVGTNKVNISALRSLRGKINQKFFFSIIQVLRPLRTISTIKELKILLETLISALPYLANSLVILFFFFLVYAIAGLQLFSGLLKRRCFSIDQGIQMLPQNYINDELCGGQNTCPDQFFCGKGLHNPNFEQNNFDTIFYAYLNVFQVITLEGWTQIEAFVFNTLSIYSVLYFYTLVFIGAFFLVNLTLAVIKSKFTDQESFNSEQEQSQNQKDLNQNKDDSNDENQESSSSSDDEDYFPPIEILRKHRSTIRDRLKISSLDQARLEIHKKLVKDKGVGEIKSSKILFEKHQIEQSVKMKEQVENRTKQPVNTLIEPQDKKGNDELLELLDEVDFQIQNNKERSSVLLQTYNQQNRRIIQKQNGQQFQQQFESFSKQKSNPDFDRNLSSQKNTITPSPLHKQQSFHLNTYTFSPVLYMTPQPMVIKKSTFQDAKSPKGSPLRFGKTFYPQKITPPQCSPRQMRKTLYQPSNKLPQESLMRKTFYDPRSVDKNNKFSSQNQAQEFVNTKAKQIQYQARRKNKHSKLSRVTALQEIIKNLKQIDTDSNSVDYNQERQLAEKLFGKENQQESIEKTPNSKQSNHEIKKRNSIHSDRVIEDMVQLEILKEKVICRKKKESNKQLKEKSKLNKLDLNKFKFEIWYPEREIFTSVWDIMEAKLLKKNQEALRNTENIIKNKKYEFIYQKRIENRSNKDSMSDNLIKNSDRNIVIQQNYFEFKKIIQTQDYIPQGVLIGDLRRPDIAIPIKRSYRLDEQKIQNKGSIKDSIYMSQLFQSQYKSQNNRSSKLMIRFKKKPNFTTSTAESPKKTITYEQAIQELIKDEDIVDNQNDQISNQHIYWALKQQDFETGIKNQLIWSGDDVLINEKYQWNKINIIFDNINTQNQDSLIYMNGIIGITNVILKNLNNLIRSRGVENFLTLVVFCNTAVLALDTQSNSQAMDNFIINCNQIFTYIFIVEFSLKLIGFKIIGYIKDKMNLFDGCIVILSIVEIIFLNGGNKAISAFRAIRIFRTFRVLRVARLLRSLKFMQVIIGVIGRSVKSYIYIVFLLFLFIVIYSLLGMQFYSGLIQNLRYNQSRVKFDDFYSAFAVIFQLMTLENWNDILMVTLRTTVNKFQTVLYLLTFIFIGNWVFLNLFLAILLDGFISSETDQDLEEDEEELTISNFDNKYLENIQIKLKEKHSVEKTNYYSIQKNQNQDYQVDALKLFNISIMSSSVVPQQLQQSTHRLSTLAESQYTFFKTDSIDVKEHDKRKKERRQLFKGCECEYSLFIFSKQNQLRIFLFRLITHPKFDLIILGFIIFSSLKLAIDTYIQDGSQISIISSDLDTVFNFIFILEASSKIIALGFFGDQGSYLTESWSQLDFFIVLSSVIDMTFQNINLPVIKVLRLLRTFKPLRFISHNVNMRIVVTALLESVVAIFNVLIVMFMIWTMFAILGMSLLGGRLGYCNINNYFNVSKSQCQQQGQQWISRPYTFDNFYEGIKFLFVLSSLEGWPVIMDWCIDSNFDTYGPDRNNYWVAQIYIIVFIMVGSLFLMNLFVGVIFYNFIKAQKNEQTGSYLLTEEQQNWIEIQKMIITTENEFTSHCKPSNPFRGFIFLVIHKWWFEVIIMVCIVINILIMAMTYEGQDQIYSNVLENINLFFTFVFILETILKFIGIGPSGFWISVWNRFDLFVVTTSILDIIIKTLTQSQDAKFLRVGPQLIRVIRVLRVTRLLKLVKSMRSLKKLVDTLLFTLPSLMNVGALLTLVFFIFAVLGVFLFKDTPPGIIVDTNYNNFNNFGNAILILFRCSTGEDWPSIMFDCSEKSVWAQVYFMIFIMMVSFIMLNLFILILIQYFEDYHLKEDNPLDQFKDNLEIFREKWAKYSEEFKGEKIRCEKAIDFFHQLDEPLGYAGKIPKQIIAKEIMCQNLVGDGNNNLMFSEVLYTAMRKVFGKNYLKGKNEKLLLHLQQIEADTRLKIENKKQKFLHRSSKLLLDDQNGYVNPLEIYILKRMCFVSWLNYSKKNFNDSDEEIESEQQSEQNEINKMIVNFNNFGEIREEGFAEEEEHDLKRNWGFHKQKQSDQYGQ